jgi:hypothetical protein
LTSDLSGYLPLIGGTLTGALSGTSATFSSTATATAFIPSGATVPTNGMYLSAANTLDFATNSVNRLSISSAGAATFSGADLTVTSTSTQPFLRVSRTGTGARSYYWGINAGSTLFLQDETAGVTRITLTAANVITLSSDVIITGTLNSQALTGTSATFSGSVSKGSGSFRITHPLPSLSETHQLVHSFIEGPQADLIYRGKLTLVNGKAQANIDEVSTMTEGTFEALCREIQCFTTNESGWDLIKGKVIGNIIYIESQNDNSTDEISWMVIGERKDKHMMDTEWTDENGKVIVEPFKPIEPKVVVTAQVDAESEPKAEPIEPEVEPTEAEQEDKPESDAEPDTNTTQ